MENDEEVEFVGETPLPEDETKKQCPKSAKIIIIILSIIIVAIIAVSITFFFLLNEEENPENAGGQEGTDKPDKPSKKKVTDENTLYNIVTGDIIRNITYADSVIKNTFVNGNIHYNENMGVIHEGLDYKATVKNKYDLFVPYSVKKTQKTKGVILIIHGGAWISGKKEDMDIFSTILYRAGYIIAQMSYTLLEEGNKDANMYRMVDEIFTCINHIKNHLEKEYQLQPDQYGFGIGGQSAGAHLSLLYGYMIKDSPLPIKFILNLVGPVTLTPHYYIMVNDTEEPFDDLNKIDLEEINKNKAKYPVTSKVPHKDILKWLHYALGKPLNEAIIDSMLTDDRADENNENYKKLIEEAKYLYPVTYISDDCPPTYCFYGGRDEYVGFLQYPLLIEEAKKHPKFYSNIKFIYSKYGGHFFGDFNPEHEFKSFMDLYYYFLDAPKKYF